MHLYAEKSGKADDLSELESGSIQPQVVAAERQKDERRHVHRGHLVRIFFSLSLVTPIIAMVLGWIYLHGALAYIRRSITTVDNFPIIAALYWIGQTFTLFVFLMDIAAIAESTNLNDNEALFTYQYYTIMMIILVEGFGFTASLVLSIIPLLSHRRSMSCKNTFNCYYTYICCGVLSSKKVKRKEARVWLCLSGLLTPIISAASHTGFVVAGWISYPDRSVAIIVYYTFLFVFLYWSLQHIYLFSVRIANFFRKTEIFERKPTNRDSFEGASQVQWERTPDHHSDQVTILDRPLEYNETKTTHPEEEISEQDSGHKKVGFDTIALFLMFTMLILLYGVIAYLGYGQLLSVLGTIDEAIVHVYTLVEYVFVIAIFLVTYKVFKTGSSRTGSSGGRIWAGNALKYWRFLHSGPQYDYHINTLQQAVELLQITVHAFREHNNIDKISEFRIKKKKFDLEEVKDFLTEAKNSITSPTNGQQQTDSGFSSTLREAIAKLEDEVEAIQLRSLRTAVTSIKDMVQGAEQHAQHLSKMEKVAMKRFTDGVHHFTNILVSALDIPPMYLNSDKVDALTAAFVFNNMRGTEEDGGAQRRYSLLLSLIQEGFK